MKQKHHLCIGVIMLTFLSLPLLSHAKYDASKVVRNINNLTEKNIGDKIGLKFTAGTVSLSINGNQHNFDVQAFNKPYDRSPGDQLLEITEAGNRTQIINMWRIISIEENNLVLENIVYKNYKGVKANLHVNKKDLQGFVKPGSKKIDAMILSLFVFLAALGTQI